MSIFFSDRPCKIIKQAISSISNILGTKATKVSKVAFVWKECQYKNTDSQNNLLMLSNKYIYVHDDFKYS